VVDERLVLLHYRVAEKGEKVHYLSPMRPERPEETHAALKAAGS
jgi:hypothetical protein